MAEGASLTPLQLVEHPSELRTVQRILEQWNSGHGPAPIAKELGRLKIKTRKGGAWDHSLVTRIIDRVSRRVYPYDRLATKVRTYVLRKRTTINNRKEKEI